MSNRNVASLVTSSGVLLFIDGKEYAVGNDHPNFTKIKASLKAKAYDTILDMIDIPAVVRRWISAGVEFALVGDAITLNGEAFSSGVTNKVLNMIEAGNSADPLFNFLRKVRQNPSKVAQDELLLFCVANGFLIHEDGDILAYKSIQNNYTDIHSGRMKVVVGTTVRMERHQVDDRRENTCSTGLHFASHKYATTWHGRSDARLVVMKIHPKNVVSIPSDYNNEKGRCSEYFVLAEIPHTSKALPKREVYTTADLTPRGNTVTVAADVDLESELELLEAEYLRVKRAKKAGSSVQAASILKNIQKIQRAIDAGLDSVDDLDDRLAEAEGELEAAESNRDSKQGEIDDVTNEVQDIRERIDQIEDLGGDATSLQDELDELEQRENELIDELETIEDEIESLESEIEELR